MFIFKKHLDRRTFLRGMGATVALPLLDAMIPARTALAATAARPVPRLAFVYFPHGAIMSEWMQAGRQAGFGRVLEPLLPFRDRLTIVSGVENRHAYGPVHAITPGTWLAGRAAARCTAGSDAGDFTTADQVAAAHLGGDTLLPSIEAATEEAREIATGPWEGRFDASYGRTISFRAGVARPMEASPRRILNRLFDRRDTADERCGASVLDRVAGDAASLPSRLGPRDRATFSEYLDSIRDLERRVDRAEARRLMNRPAAADEHAFAERLPLLFDLIALAFRADITRVASLMMAAETSAMTYGRIGVPEPFHLLSHHQNDPAKIEALVRIQQDHSRAFAGFVRTLADLPDGDGSLLDRSLMLYGSNMSDSHRHDHAPLPLAVVGGGGGALHGGGHVRCPDHTPLSNLLVTLLHRAGVPVTTFGDSTGECAGI